MSHPRCHSKHREPRPVRAQSVILVRDRRAR